MFFFRRKRPLRIVAGWLIKDLTPTTESCKFLIKACQLADPPVLGERGLIEAGIAELFIVHESVFAAARTDNDREAILPGIHEMFVRNFASLASKADFSEGDLLDLIARRLSAYDSLMDRSLPNLPNWHLMLADEIFEKFTSTRAGVGPGPIVVIGIPVLKMANVTTDFVRTTLRNYARER